MNSNFSHSLVATRNAFITIRSREILPIAMNGIEQRYFYNNKKTGKTGSRLQNK